MSFIDDVVAANPTIASQYIAGQTYEKRNLKVIVLNTTTSQRKVIIDSYDLNSSKISKIVFIL